MTIRQAVNIFLADRSTFCAQSTLIYYRDRLDNFLIWTDAKGYIDYNDLSEDVLQQYLLFLRSHKLKGTSIHNYFRAIYTMLHYFELECDLMHIKKIKLPKQDPDLILPLNQAEAYHLFDAVNKYDPKYFARNMLIIRFMLDCGLRSSEVRNLKKTDITNDSILIQFSKYQKSRVLPLPDSIALLIKQLPESSSLFLLSDDSGEQLSKNSIKQFFQKLKIESGVLRVHAHLLRHTFATSYMFYYGNLEFLRIYMGHASFDVTHQYVNISNQCLLSDFDIYKIPDCYK